jgi:predicted oxidoreductase
MKENRLIYGTMGIGGGWTSDTLTESAIKEGTKAIKAALDCGITTFDFANIYQKGKAEEVFGLYLEKNKHFREKLFIQSKVGIELYDDPSKNKYNFSKIHVIEAVEAILRRLKTNYLDCLILHRFDPLMDPKELSEAIQEMKTRGLFKNLGVSNMSHHQIKIIEKITKEKVTVNQLEMSLKKRDWLEGSIMFNHGGYQTLDFPVGTIEYCQLNGIELQAWGSLGQGIYSGRPLKEPIDESVKKTRDLVSKLSKEKNVSNESIVIAWLLKHPSNIRPVIGSTNEKRIKNIAESTKVDLTREEWYDLFVSARGNVLP